MRLILHPKVYSDVDNLTGVTILVSRGITVLPAAPARELGRSVDAPDAQGLQ